MPGGSERFVVADRNDLVDQVHVEHFRHESGPDALDPVRAHPAPGKHRRGCRLDRVDAGGRSLVPEVPGHAGDGSPGADSADKGVDISAGVGPDLRSGRAEVRFRIGRVRELEWHVSVPLGRDPLGQFDRLVHSAHRRGFLDLCSVSTQELGPFPAHSLGHGQHQLVPAGSADHRQGDSGVAAGRFDDHRLAPDQFAAGLGRADHRRPDPVLDRTPGVEVLELGADLGVEPVRDPGQPDQRRSTDRCRCLRRDQMKYILAAASSASRS